MYHEQNCSVAYICIYFEDRFYFFYVSMHFRFDILTFKIDLNHLYTDIFIGPDKKILFV